MRKLWRKFGILVTGYDAEKSRRESEALQKAFDALPKPKNEIPTTLRKVKWK